MNLSLPFANFKPFVHVLAVLFVFALATPTVWGQTPQIEWIRQFDTSYSNMAYGISADSSGIYMTGATASTGNWDVFLRKYGSSGTELWTRQFGTLSYERTEGIYVDSSGVYVVGVTSGILQGQISAGSEDAFIRKYDASGTELWTRQFGTSNSDYATQIYSDSSGVYVIGYTYGTFPHQISTGDQDAFVRKYDASGTELWTRQFGSLSKDWAYGVSADSSGIYVTGVTWGILPDQTSSGSTDAFLRKYSFDGEELFTRQFGTSSGTGSNGVSADSSGVYVIGNTGGNFPDQISAGSSDTYIRKYDASGTELWTRQFGTSSNDFAYEVSADSSGIYLIGTTHGTLPGQIGAGGYGDAFVRKYDADGVELWTLQFGTSSADNANGISVSSLGVYVTGYTGGSFSGHPTAGNWDAFVAKITDIAENQPPTANANGPYNCNEGSACTFNGGGSSDPDHGDSITLYEWDFDYDGVTFTVDASGAALINPSHAYGDGNAVKTLALRVTDSQGVQSIATASVTVNNVAPTATFNAPTLVDEGSTISLSLTTPSDPSSADIAVGFTYAFDCGTGYGEYGSSASSNCATTDNGIINVKGKIKDKDGGEREYIAAVTVNNVAPTIALNPSYYTTVPITLRISGQGKVGNSVTFEAVQNGKVLASNKIIRTSGSPDEQEVTLSATIDLSKPYNGRLIFDTETAYNGGTPVWVIIGGNMTKVTTFNTQKNNPSSYHQTYEFALAGLFNVVNRELTFTGTGTDMGNDDMTFDWAFGDGSVISVPYTWSGSHTLTDTVRHTYLVNGSYIVSLKVTDDDGGVSSDSRIIQIP